MRNLQKSSPTSNSLGNISEIPTTSKSNLETKTIVVIEQSKRKNTKIFEIVSIPLKLSDTIDKRPQQLAQQILQKCSSKNDLSGEQIKYFLKNIVLYFFQQNIHNKSLKQKQEEEVDQLRNQLQTVYNEIQQRTDRIEEWCVSKLKNWQLILQKHRDQLQNTCEKEIKALKELNRLKQQKQFIYQIQIQQIKSQAVRVAKNIQEIQTSFFKDVNVLGLKFQRLEKLMNGKQPAVIKRQFKKEQQIQFKMQQQIQPLKRIGNKIQNRLKIIESKKWVDLDFYGMNNIHLNGNTITALSFTSIFGKDKLTGTCQFSVKFIKIKGIVSLGIVDSSNKKDIFNQNYNLIQYANNGSWQVGGAEFYREGGGFKQGELVTVVVDLGQGCVQWRVDDQIRFQLIHALLRDNSISWVPFMQLRNKDDSVQIYQVIV